MNGNLKSPVTSYRHDILENRSMGRMGVIKGIQEETISKLILCFTNGGAVGQKEKRKRLSVKRHKTKQSELPEWHIMLT